MCGIFVDNPMSVRIRLSDVNSDCIIMYIYEGDKVGAYVHCKNYGVTSTHCSVAVPFYLVHTVVVVFTQQFVYHSHNILCVVDKISALMR